MVDMAPMSGGTMTASMSAGTITASRSRERLHIGQYRGLLSTVANVKDTVENERTAASAKQRHLETLLEEHKKESLAIKQELNMQLKCRGVSYNNLVIMNRETEKQLQHEKDLRKTEVDVLDKQIKDLKSQISTATKPWKEEVSKRDLKILQLQEATTDLEGKFRSAKAELPVLAQTMQAEIDTRDQKCKIILKENDDLRQQMTAKEEAAAEELKKEKERAHQEKIRLETHFRETAVSEDEVKAPLERTIRELNLKIEGLEKKLEQVDYTPYEQQIESKEVGYARLVKDFQISKRITAENNAKMRESFEEVMTRLDKRVQESEAEAQRQLQPWKDKVAKQEAEIETLQNTLIDIRKKEIETREREKETQADLERRLEAAKGAVEHAQKEANQVKKDLEKHIEEAENQSHHKKIRMLEMRLDDVTQECEKLVAGKDKELKDKAELIMRLQKRVLEQTQRMDEMDKEWDRRIQVKEEGYSRTVAELRFAEAQILEEREKTAAALKTIQTRERDIKRLKAEHTTELAVRLQDRNELLEEIAELEEKVEAELQKQEIMSKSFEAEFDAFRRRGEDRVADLKAEITLRDRIIEKVKEELQSVRSQYEKARSSWEEKERELEIAIRNRDRIIVSLRNELELVNDSWEVKYNRLLVRCEKMQRKYEDVIGKGGHAEAHNRARDLKFENEELHKEILAKNEELAKNKRQIRDLWLKMDIHLEKTADILATKDSGIAKMVGEYHLLEAKFRREHELREQQIKELKAEKDAIGKSFEPRINQLLQVIEALRFTDRQELVDKIQAWKENYDRVVIEKDDLEEEFLGLIDIKEKQMKKLAEEIAEAVALGNKKEQEALQQVEVVEKKWKMQETKWVMAKQEVEEQLRVTASERDKAQKEAEKSKLFAEEVLEDPEKDELRKAVEVHKANCKQVEAGLPPIVKENTELRKENAELREKMKDAAAEFEPQIRWRDERYNVMVKEHEELKKVLLNEMETAQLTCKTIEQSFRKFPNPFEEEIKEMKDKYAQMQAGMRKMSLENIKLREELKDKSDDHQKEIDELEHNLKLAGMLLKEVSSLGALQSLAAPQMSQLERAIGFDLDGDGQVG